MSGRMAVIPTRPTILQFNWEEKAIQIVQICGSATKSEHAHATDEEEGYQSYRNSKKGCKRDTKMGKKVR